MLAAILRHRIAMLDAQRRLAFAFRAPASVHAIICAASRRAIERQIALAIREARG